MVEVTHVTGAHPPSRVVVIVFQQARFDAVVVDFCAAHFVIFATETVLAHVVYVPSVIPIILNPPSTTISALSPHEVVVVDAARVRAPPRRRTPRRRTPTAPVRAARPASDARARAYPRASLSSLRARARRVERVRRGRLNLNSESNAGLSNRPRARAIDPSRRRRARRAAPVASLKRRAIYSLIFFDAFAARRGVPPPRARRDFSRDLRTRERTPSVGGPRASGFLVWRTDLSSKTGEVSG